MLTKNYISQYNEDIVKTLRAYEKYKNNVQKCNNPLKPLKRVNKKRGKR